ncbi:dienelactone hydrolase family protein [Sphingobium sp. AN641]|uniref:dienelactone hydrolase family protein n=1 Tax=Sphingobium sp. AN641 TaxID=3133443 RepID=UPI0030C3A910
MTISRRPVLHDGFDSLAVVDVSAACPLPGIILFPNVLGTKEQDFVRAERVAALGYAVLVADVYGAGKRTTREDPEMGRYMAELNGDRLMMRERLLGAHAALKALPEVDAARTAAIGYCFGGKCMLDLARSGADLAGGVSFHGVYDPPPFASATIGAKLLICHGWDDPIAPPEATVALADELTRAGCDWQIHAYGGTGHAFTDVTVAMPERGMAYDARADRRSWNAMVDFLDELFG